jgi:hypothetical protein
VTCQVSLPRREMARYPSQTSTAPMTMATCTPPNPHTGESYSGARLAVITTCHLTATSPGGRQKPDLRQALAMTLRRSARTPGRYSTAAAAAGSRRRHRC